jgi:hypothetical protein
MKHLKVKFSLEGFYQSLSVEFFKKKGLSQFTLPETFPDFHEIKVRIIYSIIPFLPRW